MLVQCIIILNWFAFFCISDHVVVRHFTASTDNIRHGRWWALILSSFMHVNIVHLALNTYAFVEIGQCVIDLYGSVYFIFVYLLSGFISSLWALYMDRDVDSVGASGNIYACLGIVVVRLATNMDYNEFWGEIVIPLIIDELFSYQFINFDLNISYWSHFGGFITGLVLGCGLQVVTLFLLSVYFMYDELLSM